MTSSVAERSSHALCATPTYTFTDVRVPVVCDVNDYWRRWTGDDNLGVRTVKGELLENVNDVLYTEHNSLDESSTQGCTKGGERENR